MVMLANLSRMKGLRGETRPGDRRPRRGFVPSGVPFALEERALLSTAAPYIIRLQPVPFGEQGVHKLGIYVGIGGGEPKLYEFDTGGGGFWAAYNPYLSPSDQWWGSYQVKTLNNLHIGYTSGNQYFANKVSTSVELYEKDASGSGFTKVVGTTEDVDLGQIVQYANPGKPWAVRSWYAALSQGKPPLEGGFYGDFGASLSPAGTNPKNTLFSILPQIPMPEGLTYGFIVHMGADGSTPYLQLGLTQDDLDSYQTQLKMTPHEGTGPSHFPITGLPTYSSRVTTATFTWTDPQTKRTQRLPDAGWTIDTGAIPVNVWQGNRVRVRPEFLSGRGASGGFRTGAFKDGLKFTVEAPSVKPGGTALKLEIPSTGRVAGVNKVAAQYHSRARMGRNYVNTGFVLFATYDVMYDLRGGRIGFRPAGGG